MTSSDITVTTLKMAKKLSELGTQGWVGEFAIANFFQEFGGAWAKDPTFHQRVKHLVAQLPDTLFKQGLREAVEKACDQSALEDDKQQ